MMRTHLAPSPMGAGKARPRTARTGLWTCAALAAGALAGIVVFAPARWWATVVAHATGQRVVLQQPQGTLWRGSAVLALSAGAAGRQQLALPSRVHWQWSWQGASLQLALQAACCAPAPVHLRWGWHGVQLLPGQLQWPLAWLQGLGSPWNTLQLAGDVQLQWQAVQLQWPRAGAPLQWQGHMQVRARGVSTRLSTLPQVGSYALALQGGAVPQLTLSTIQGPLQLDGQGQWQARGWQFRGQAQAEPAHAAELANLLTLIGQRQGNKFVMRWG